MNEIVQAIAMSELEKGKTGIYKEKRCDNSRVLRFETRLKFYCFLEQLFLREKWLNFQMKRTRFYGREIKSLTIVSLSIYYGQHERRQKERFASKKHVYI